MTRGQHRLSGTAVRRTKPGLYADGGGLYLQVRAKDGKGTSRSWIFRYKVNNRDRYAGLGSLNTIGLAEAREIARRCRQMRLAGVDPIAERRAERATKVAENARSISFEQAAHAYVAAHGGRWRNHKHLTQWSTALRRHVFPTLGSLPVNLIDTPLVLKSLKDVWASAPETGSRLRGRIEAILDWAAVSGHRPKGDNPARWSGHLEYLLSSPTKRQVVHLPALLFRDVPSFMAELRAVNSIAARALEFLILTAARTGEVFGATWSEIDGDVWMIPASRMKGGREHEVPLSKRAREILEQMAALRRGDLIFPGRTGRNCLAAVTFRWLLAKLGHQVTVHGFRSSFRDWCGERTNFPREVAEAALAHVVGDRTERAYRRGSALEQRRLLMESWARFCSERISAGEVVPLRGAS
jgi:integrase